MNRMRNATFGKSELKTYRNLLWIVFFAFALRGAVRCYSGSEDFWANGYEFFFELAQNIAAGKGPLLEEYPTANRVPLYPIFLALVTFGQKTFLPILFSQSLIGAGTVLCAALLAREIFGNVAAVGAATIAAIYPYYVVHDTALQETSLFTLLVGIAVFLLLRVRRRGHGITAACAGIALGAAVLTRASIAPFAFLAPLWLTVPGVFRAGPLRQRAAVICWSAIAVTLSPWFSRTYHLIGLPVLSSNVGYQLWRGNNPYTFSRYPTESIDRSIGIAFEAFGPQEQAEIKALSGDELALDHWFLCAGINYIYEHPGLTVTNAFRKLGAAFGWLPSPRHSFWPNLIHAVSYGFVLILGLWGMWACRRCWCAHLIFYGLFFSFAGVTAVFYGHTSHRAFLDVYFIVFAAGALERLRSRYVQRSSSIQTGELRFTPQVSAAKIE
jgi:4-amino-4-deoxy-L-arabinose transferase-like glycosyltransferase